MRKTKEANKPPEKMSSALSHRKLQEIVDYVHAEHGRLAEFCRRFNALSGENVNRVQMDRWLAEDKRRRQQPRFGTGLMLIETYNQRDQ